MGAKFANIQIKNGNIESVKNLCPAVYTISSLSNGWITITGPGLEWGTAQPEAKRISKEIDCSILSVEYFDDDFVEFAIFKKGKKVAGHTPAEYEGFPRSLGKPKKFAEALELGSDNEKILKVIFKEQSPEICVHLMESLLACVLWADDDSIEYAKPIGRDYLEQYIYRKAAKDKIKNKTKLTLLDELLGDWGFGLTYPVVRQENGDGSDKSVWSISTDGRWQKDFSVDEPGQVEEYRSYCRTDTKTVLTFALRRAQNIRMNMCCFSNTGDMIEKIESDDFGTLHASFLNDFLLFREGVCHDLCNHTVLWDLGLGITAHGIKSPQKLENGSYVFVYDTIGESAGGFLATFDLNGNITHRFQMPEAWHWGLPVVDGMNIYMGYYTSLNKSVFSCLNMELHETWNIEIPGVSELEKPLFDTDSHIVYFKASYDSVVAVNTAERKIVASMKIPDDKYISLLNIIPAVGLVVQTGDSTIEVWNDRLEIISRHRTKGAIMEIIQEHGQHYITTLKENSGANSDVARIYQLQPVGKYSFITTVD